ncbi:MAG TPA: hypothetical protein VIF64_21780, partial [Pyrinomonadaceae bacterium]
LLTSVVREICTLRSVGAGERVTALGHPVGTTPSGIPTAIANNRHSLRLGDPTGHNRLVT